MCLGWAGEGRDMGPKNSAVTPTIAPSKDLSWIDRVYLKLENMCVEVDKNPSILLQETSKYMENHMNVVGANVKKLCTELIQDLISQPILSSDGADKMPECAIHCKCNCMDFEKPKQKGVDMVTKGSNPKGGHGLLIPPKEGDKRIESANCQMQDILKERDMKVESRQNETSKQGQDSNMEASTLNSEASGKELDFMTGTDSEEELTMAGERKELEMTVKTHETGSNREFEQQFNLCKENPVLIGEDQDDGIKAYGNNFKHDDTREEKCGSAVACRGEVDLVEQASRPKENDCQELDTVEGMGSAHTNNVAQSSSRAGCLRVQEVKTQQLAVNVFSGTHVSGPNSISKVCREWDTSHAKMQNCLDLKVASLAKTDAKDAKSCWKIMGREEVEMTEEADGDFQSMYSYVFSEQSKPNQEDDPMIMSDFVIEDHFEDEEQSAHWFDGEDLSRTLHTESFCIEKLQRAESCVRDYESDWELL